MTDREQKRARIEHLLSLFKIVWLFGCLFTVFHLTLRLVFGLIIQSSLSPISNFGVVKLIGLSIGHLLVLVLFTKDLIYGYQLKNKALNNQTLITVVILAIANLFALTKQLPILTDGSISTSYERIPWTTVIYTLMLIYAYFGLIYNRIKALKKVKHE